MAVTEEGVRAAGTGFKDAAGYCMEDVAVRRLHYHLLRLTSIGLAFEELQELTELARLAFQRSKVADQCNRIKQRAGVSALAFTIASIAEEAETGGGQLDVKAAMLGAVLGAYAAAPVFEPPVNQTDEVFAAVSGATGGAVAMSMSNLIAEHARSTSLRVSGNRRLNRSTTPEGCERRGTGGAFDCRLGHRAGLAREGRARAGRRIRPAIFQQSARTRRCQW